MSTHMPGFQSFLKTFLCRFVLAKLATSSIRVKGTPISHFDVTQEHWGRLLNSTFPVIGSVMYVISFEAARRRPEKPRVCIAGT